MLLVDSLAAVAGGAASRSSNTTYIESAAGVGEGARTGLASVVTGALFLLALFSPRWSRSCRTRRRRRRWSWSASCCWPRSGTSPGTTTTIAIPAFLTIVLMPFTYSITNGIGAGFISYVVIKAVRGRGGEVHPLLWVVALPVRVYFAIGPIERLLGIG